jgi:hypothetical protein
MLIQNQKFPKMTLTCTLIGWPCKIPAWTRVHRHNATALLGQVDRCTIKLGLEVVHVGGEENKGNDKDTNEDRGGLVGGGRSLNDGAVLADNLDSLHVGTGVVIGVLGDAGESSRLALSGLGVDLFAGFNNLIGVVGIVSVVVPFFRLLARDAVQVDEAGVAVGKLLSVGKVLEHLLATVFVSKGGALVVGEHTEEDLSSLRGTVGSKEVLNLLLLELTTSVVEVVLATLHVILEIEVFFLLLVVSVGVLNITLVSNALINQTIVDAVVLVKTTAAVILVAVAAHFLHVLTTVFPVAGTGFEEYIKEYIQVDDVVAVPAVASTGVGRTAFVRGTEAESSKTLGLNTNILFAVGLFVPLRDVVTSLELDGVSSNPGVVNLVIFFDTTSILHDLVSKRRVGLDSVTKVDLLGRPLVVAENRHGGRGRSQGHESEKELHDC